MKTATLMGVAFTLCACATTKGPTHHPQTESSTEHTIGQTLPETIEQAPIAVPKPDSGPGSGTTPESNTGVVINPDIVPEPEVPKPEVPEPENVPTPLPPTSKIEMPGRFLYLPFWAEADVLPALKAFQKTCRVWEKRKDESWLHTSHSEYGQYKDWRKACQQAVTTRTDSQSAKAFFQSHFLPLQTHEKTSKTEGLLTAYYAPEIEVRLQADPEFYEPLLARPKDADIQNLPRESLGVLSSKVLAYGRPVDVFFLQVQGSGRIRFADGSRYVAAFNGHNGHKYKSIGSVLVKRGEMTLAQASKQAIENWMEAEGYVATRELMNQNPRYIFFKTEYLQEGVGPKGAMNVPLTAMGSLAIDPRAHPYGALIWLDVKLPKIGGDFTGKQTGLLLAAQDTGGAIKGTRRGDIYFGAGKKAGERAGVMKHKGKWTLFLPTALALSIETGRLAVS